MSAKQPRAGMGRPAASIEGVVPGGTEHQILLALRGPGGMTSEQITNRFGHQGGALHRLRIRGLIEMPGVGQKGFSVRLTDAGRALTDAGAPLCRSKTLITYCQL